MAWQLPTRIESIVLSFALARLGATQVPIIPIYREREVGSVLAQAGARFFAVPGVWRNFDYEAMARGLQESSGGAFETLVVTADLENGGLPEGDPSTLPAAARPTATPSAGSTPPRARRRTRRACMHTDGALIAGGIGLAHALEMPAARRRLDRVPVRAHRRSRLPRGDARARACRRCLLEAFDPANAVATFARHDVTMAGGSTAFYLDVPQRAAQGPVDADHARRCA